MFFHYDWVNMELSDKVRALRKEYGYTLRQLSELTTLSVPFLSDIEHGRANPSYRSLRSIADALNINLADLFDGVNEDGTGYDSLPDGLVELINDEEYGDELTSEWIRLLKDIHLRGRFPETKREWMEIYFVLKRILDH